MQPNAQNNHNQPGGAPQQPYQPAHHEPQPPTNPSNSIAASVSTMPEFNEEPAESNSRESVPVVKVWSVRGVEYAIMSFMLWGLAIAVNWVLVALVNGESGFVQLAAPLSLLIVGLPIFAVFFLRLKKAELMNPKLKLESTKRRFSQITQIVSFFVVFFASLTIVASLIASAGGESENLGKTIGTAFVFIVVWGALFAYYWVDEHKALR